MKRFTHLRSPRSTRWRSFMKSTRLRLAAVVAAVLSLLALTACSSNSAGSTGVRCVDGCGFCRGRGRTSSTGAAGSSAAGSSAAVTSAAATSAAAAGGKKTTISLLVDNSPVDHQARHGRRRCVREGQPRHHGDGGAPAGGHRRRQPGQDQAGDRRHGGRVLVQLRRAAAGAGAGEEAGRPHQRPRDRGGGQVLPARRERRRQGLRRAVGQLVRRR